jgi:hypothetical protein
MSITIYRVQLKLIFMQRNVIERGTGINNYAEAGIVDYKPAGAGSRKDR